MLGLYIHVPFCSSICNYCNFNRGLFDERLKTRYVAALLQEIRGASLGGAEALCHQLSGSVKSLSVAQGAGSVRTDPSPVAQDFSPVQADTLYFGGGTPSLLTPEE